MFRRPSKWAPSATEEAAASERLRAVMGRGKGEGSLYPAQEEQLKTPTIRRRFWTPDELVETPH
jgi:hypothetical protein